VKKNMPPFYGPAGCTAVTPRSRRGPAWRKLPGRRNRHATASATGCPEVQVPSEEVPMREDFNASDGEDAYDDDDYGDDDEYPGQQDLPWPPASPPYAGPPGPPDRRARHAIVLAVIAALAAVAGFIIVTAIHDVSASPAAANGATPGATAPTGGTSGNPPASPLPSSGSGGTLQLEIGGKVVAVSATSITLDGAGQQITAAVTSATKVTGRVTSIAGVKPGDLVSAQLTGTGGNGGKLTAAAIQDPASLP
jgi:hypothetical protein